MSHLILPLLIIMCIVIAVAIAAAVKKNQRSDEVENDENKDESDYDGYERRKFLFTPAEYAFFKVLQVAVGAEYSIQAKVRIADLIEVRRGCTHHQRKVNYITRKHLDFILCDPKTMVPMLAIELDDRSHDAADRHKRDVFVNGLMTAVGMPFLRVPVARGYNTEEIRASVSKTLSVKAA